MAGPTSLHLLEETAPRAYITNALRGETLTYLSSLTLGGKVLFSEA